MDRAPTERLPLAAALLGACLAWLPWVGVAVSLAAVLLRLAAGRRCRARGWSLALALWGLLLGGLFTALPLLLPPPPETGEERRLWEAFDRRFQPPGAQPGGPARGPGAGDERALP